MKTAKSVRHLSILLGVICCIANSGIGKAQTSKGPAASLPTTQVVGWRGDGTGRYPNATPPTEWYLKANGESKNIAWKVKLPCYSWATPVIVGDKLFTRSEPYDLICMDKKDGKVLWIRSYPPFVAVTSQEKEANSAWNEVAQLVDDLQKVNDEFVAKGWTEELYKKKYDLQHKIDDLTAKTDKKYALPRDMYVESWSGYTGSTPVSDGKFIYISSGDGVTICYDLDGKAKWTKYESLANIWGEHGSACSPTLVGNTLLISNTQVYALDKATGKEIWKNPKGANGYSILPFKMGGTDYVMTAGVFYRVSDGKLIADYSGGPQGVIQGDMAFVTRNHVGIYKLAAKGDGELSVTPQVKDEYQRMELPLGVPEKKWEPINFNTASPLYVDGLLYCLSTYGWLVAVDTSKTSAKDAMVYSLFPPFDFKNKPQRKSIGMGIGASPALAGKYIYMMDSANCTLVLEPGREFKQVAKNVIDYTVPSGWEPKHWMGPHAEQTEASLVFEGSRIYLRGEQFMYCIGQK